MLPIDNEQRAVRILQYGAADRADEFSHTLTIVSANNHQPHRSAMVSQVLHKAAVHHHRFDPQLRIPSLPTGQPAIEAGKRPAIAFGIRPTPVGWHGSPVVDRQETSVTQQGLFDGGAQQYTVVRRLVHLDDDFLRGPAEVAVAASNDRHRAARRHGQSRSGGTHPARLKVT